MQNKFLHPPVQQFSHEDYVLRRASNFVNPAKLLEFLAGLAEPTQDFSVQAEFVDAAREGIGGIQHLIRSGSNADRPGRAGSQLSCKDVRPAEYRFRANRRDFLVIIKRHINLDLAEVLTFFVEYFDAGITAVCHIDISLRIGSNAVRRVELSGPVAGFPERFKPAAMNVDLGHTGINIAI